MPQIVFLGMERVGGEEGRKAEPGILNEMKISLLFPRNLSYQRTIHHCVGNSVGSWKEFQMFFSVLILDLDNIFT